MFLKNEKNLAILQTSCFDNFSGQCSPELFETVDNRHIYNVLIPPNCTDRLQPLDLSVNKRVQKFLRRHFHKWYAGLVCAQVQKSQVEVIDLRLTVVKFLGAKSMDKLYDYLKSKPEIVCNGFRGAGTYTVAVLYTFVQQVYKQLLYALSFDQYIICNNLHKRHNNHY